MGILEERQRTICTRGITLTKDQITSKKGILKENESTFDKQRAFYVYLRDVFAIDIGFLYHEF